MRSAEDEEAPLCAQDPPTALALAPEQVAALDSSRALRSGALCVLVSLVLAALVLADLAIFTEKSGARAVDVRVPKLPVSAASGVRPWRKSQPDVGFACLLQRTDALMSGSFQLVGFEPLLDVPDIVHHMDLFICTAGADRLGGSAVGDRRWSVV